MIRLTEKQTFILISALLLVFLGITFLPRSQDQSNPTGNLAAKTVSKDNHINLKPFALLPLTYQTLPEFISLHPIFTQDKNNPDQVIISSGRYLIPSTIIIPQGITVKIDPGVNLNFAPKASLISYSQVLAVGTKVQPISFTGNSSKSWGVFAVLDRSRRQSRFDFVTVQNGSQAYINGVFFSGALAIHGGQALVTNSAFLNNNGDDGLNIKYSQVTLNNNRFINNRADGLDLDSVKGIVSNNQFQGNGNDGLDISFSELKIIDNRISASGDKCLSIGEKTITTITANIISGCITGIAVKDESEATLINNKISNVQKDIDSYIKKPIFKSPKTSFSPL